MYDTTTLPSDADLLTEDEIQTAVIDEYVKAGLSKISKGANAKDPDKLRDRVYEKVTSRVVASRSEMSAKSWTQGELYSAVFPGAPGTDPNQLISELTPLEQAVRARLMRQCWTLTNPDRKGTIQLRLGKEGRSEILVRTSVQRGVDEIIGAFITNDGKLIVEEAVTPRVEKLLGAAKEVRLFNDLVVEARHPELGGQLTKILEGAKRRVSAELTRPAQPAIAAPAETGDAAE